MLYILLGYQVLLYLFLHLAIFCVGFFLLWNGQEKRTPKLLYQAT